MLKNQHTYAEISADRSVPKPLQPPHLLYFDTLILLDQKEKVPFVFFKLYIICETDTFSGKYIELFWEKVIICGFSCT